MPPVSRINSRNQYAPFFGGGKVAPLPRFAMASLAREKLRGYLRPTSRFPTKRWRPAREKFSMKGSGSYAEGSGAMGSLSAS